MYYKIFDAFFSIMMLKPGAEASVFGAILALCSRSSDPTPISLRILSQMTGYHRDTVIESIKDLTNRGYIVPIPCSGRTTKYSVQLPTDMQEMLKNEAQKRRTHSSVGQKPGDVSPRRFEVHGDTER